MSFDETKIRAIAEKRRLESEAVDPERLKDHPLAAAAVSLTAQIPDYDTDASRAYRTRAEQIVADDPDVASHQALLQQTDIPPRAA